MEQHKPHQPAGIPRSMQQRPGPRVAVPAQTHRPASRPQPPMPKKSKAFIAIAISLVAIAIIVVGVALTVLYKNISTDLAVKSSGYQAVFLTNNMVYFGKLSDVNENYVKMTNIYYLQVANQNQNQPSQQQTQQSQQLSLTKLGNELHGPDDVMYINRKEILFWENLKDSGKVTQAIKDYQSKNGGIK